MATIKQGFIFATCVLSGIAAILSLASLGTKYWVTSQGTFLIEEAQSERPSKINYGLFGGIFEQILGASTFFEITITCSMSDNICAYLCKSSDEARAIELQKLYSGENVTFDASCPRVIRKNFVQINIPVNNATIIEPSERTFINASLWVCTIVFLCISMLFGALSSGLAVWNTASNPVEVYFSVFGLYIYNSIALCGAILCLTLWGVAFGTTIFSNVAIFYTITGEMTSDRLAVLGFSYWLNLGSVILYIASITVLFIRQVLINQEPHVKVHLEENDSTGIMLY